VKGLDSQYAIFDTFAAESGRNAHLSGKVAAALMANASDLLASGPAIGHVDILASMVRPESTSTEAKVGLYVPLFAKPEKAEVVKKFLIDALPLVQKEPETLQWFAFRKSETEFGIFDTAAGESGRDAHLNGQVAAALMANAEELLETPPSIRKVDILALKIVV
jgi:quinol monooxygenase YgiN